MSEASIKWIHGSLPFLLLIMSFIILLLLRLPLFGSSASIVRASRRAVMCLQEHLQAQCVHTDGKGVLHLLSHGDILADVSPLPRLCLSLQEHPPKYIIG